MTSYALLILEMVKIIIMFLRNIFVLLIRSYYKIDNESGNHEMTVGYFSCTVELSDWKLI